MDNKSNAKMKLKDMLIKKKVEQLQQKCMNLYTQLFLVRVSKRQLLLVFIVLIIFNFLFGLYQLFQPMMSEYDSYRRLNLFTEYLQYSSGITWWSSYTIWPPLYFYLVGWPVFFDLPYESPRFVSFLISWLAVPGLYLLCKQYFANRILAMVGILLLIYNPLWQYLITTTLTEPITFTFIIWTLFFLQSSSRISSLFAIILLNVAHGIRFESWLILPLIWWVIFFKRKKYWWLYIILTCLFPFFYMTYNWQVTGNPIDFLSVRTEEAQQHAPTQAYSFHNSFIVWYQYILSDLGFIGLFLVIVGGIYSFNTAIFRNIFALALTACWLFVLLVMQSYFGTMYTFQHRYIFLVLFLCIPVLLLGACKISEYIFANFKNERVLVIFLLPCIYFISQYTNYEKLFKDNGLYLPITELIGANKFTLYSNEITTAISSENFIYVSENLFSTNIEYVSYALKMYIRNFAVSCVEINKEQLLSQFIIIENGCDLFNKDDYQVVMKTENHELLRKN